MIRVGDQVILMGSPGRFEVTAINGREISISNEAGVQKIVYDVAVRVVEPSSRQPGA